MFDEIRAACAYVAAKAEHVHINEACLTDYALSLTSKPQALSYDTEHHFLGEPDATLAYVVTLDTVNFGSGYFPYLKKRPGMSGYFTVASHLKDAFAAGGPFSAKELAALNSKDCAALFQQPLDNEVQLELITLFTQALNDLGAFLDDFGGSFVALVEGVDQSAERLAMQLARMPFFRDVATHQGVTVPLYKRAQITASDIALAFGGEGYGRFYDLDKLTIFADNLVPHVLHVDGVLSYSPSLREKLATGALLPPGSPEEVELRAVALHAVERLVEARRDLAGDTGVSARHLDIILWNRGQAERYRTTPRHRTRTVFY